MITAARDSIPSRAPSTAVRPDYLIKPFEFDNSRRKLERSPRGRRAAVGGRRRPVLIDSLFGGAIPARGGESPQGSGAETGELVLDAVRSAGEVSAAECAELVGISRVSARATWSTTSAPAPSTPFASTAGRPERRYRPS